MEYQVDLETFRGPLDLLLYLVKRDEVDIRDIPIARVTDQFLEYLAILKNIDFDQVGDFLVMAATLMEIKSRVLLPQGDERIAAAADPRDELVRQLLEYRRYKDAAALLESQADQQLSRLARQPIDLPRSPGPAEQPLRQVELWDLVSAFSRLIRETLALQPQQIVVDQTPVHVYMQTILDRLQTRSPLSFTSLFAPPYQRARLVGIFLALLELIREHRILIEQPEDFGEIWLRLSQNNHRDALASEFTH